MVRVLRNPRPSPSSEIQCLPGSSDGEESACNTGDLDSIPGLGRSPGEGNSNHSSIPAWEIPCTEELGRATAHRVTLAERLSLGTEQSGILILTGYFEALVSVAGVSKRKGESWPLQK